MSVTLPIEIVKAGLADIEPLRHISVLTFRETFADNNTGENMDEYISISRSSEQLQQELFEPGSEFYFALSEAKDIIGYLKINTGMAQSEPLGDAYLEIERIYVLDAYQGFHIGTHLMNKAYDIARDKRLDIVWLGVWEHNHKAIRFYQKHGFTVFDKHSFMLGKEEQTDIMMRKYLDGATVTL